MHATLNAAVIVLRVKSILNFPHSPQKNLGPRRKTFKISDSLVIEAEIKKLLDKGVIVPTHHECWEYISPINICGNEKGWIISNDLKFEKPAH